MRKSIDARGCFEHPFTAFDRDAALRPDGKEGELDLAPSLSPDGRYIAFFTGRGLFNIDLYVAEAATGRIVHRLTSPNTDNHFDNISFIASSGAWSPSGDRFAFIVQAQGNEEIVLLDVASGDRVRRIRSRDVGRSRASRGPPTRRASCSRARAAASATCT
jgi:Tol biopolymer transport system component